MSAAWMPLYWGDYLKDTRDLSTLQHGAYLLLIGHYWQHGGLPSDDKQLAAITGLSLAKWRSIREPIAAKFQEGWKHRRIDDELAKAERKITQRAISGAKGGTAAAIARAKALAFATPRFQPTAPAIAGANAQATSQATSQAKMEQKRTNHISKITTTTLEAAREEESKEPGKGLPVSPELLAVLSRKAAR